MSACHNGSTEIVSLLIEAGADITSKTTTGATPYEFADMSGYREIADYLEEVMKK